VKSVRQVRYSKVNLDMDNEDQQQQQQQQQQQKKIYISLEYMQKTYRNRLSPTKT